jgi:hypothetical protein
MSSDAAQHLAAFRAELAAVYDDLAHDVARAAPVCELSGRCCRFAEYGHTLFVSAAEFAFLLSGAPEPNRPVDDGATCPWQDDQGRCCARAARPLGCRVYYCDPAYQTLAQELSEKYIARLRELTDRHGLAWDYAPLHAHLGHAFGQGNWPRVGPFASETIDDAVEA